MSILHPTIRVLNGRYFRVDDHKRCGEQTPEDAAKSGEIEGEKRWNPDDMRDYIDDDEIVAENCVLNDGACPAVRCEDGDNDASDGVVAGPPVKSFVEVLAAGEGVKKESRPLCIRIPDGAAGLIIGQKGKNINRLKTAYSCSVNFKRVNNFDVLTLYGELAVNCLRDVYRSLDGFRDRQQPTHFVCLRLTEHGKAFMDMAKMIPDVLNQPEAVAEKLCQKPTKLHATVAMLTLLTQAEEDYAVAALREVMRSLKNSVKSTRVRLRGVDIMNDDPGEARVLFAKLNFEDDSLQRACNEVARRLHGSGFCVDQHSVARDFDVKLHCTLLNASFVNEAGFKSFDALPLLEVFKDYDFGESNCDGLYLVQRGSYVQEDGFYYSLHHERFSDHPS